MVDRGYYRPITDDQAEKQFSGRHDAISVDDSLSRLCTSPSASLRDSPRLNLCDLDREYQFLSVVSFKKAEYYVPLSKDITLFRIIFVGRSRHYNSAIGPHLPLEVGMTLNL
ncbi:hypothetical protein TNCV_68791 [Trichonephila clavipes]|nr:hypothetical protein TNCV_68791 [Trichonephila clavipes]